MDNREEIPSTPASQDSTTGFPGRLDSTLLRRPCRNPLVTRSGNRSQGQTRLDMRTSKSATPTSSPLATRSGMSPSPSQSRKTATRNITVNGIEKAGKSPSPSSQSSSRRPSVFSRPSLTSSQETPATQLSWPTSQQGEQAHHVPPAQMHSSSSSMLEAYSAALAEMQCVHGSDASQSSSSSDGS